VAVQTSWVIFVIGASLRFAVAMSSYHFRAHDIGGALMIIGPVGFGLLLMFWESWGGFGDFRHDRVAVRARCISFERKSEQLI